jgi:hypothetical protein
MGNVIHRVRERCESICKKKRSECDMNREKQTGCMADMLTSRTSNQMLTLGAVPGTGNRGLHGDKAGVKRTDECEISDWVKYLQVMHLLTLSRLVFDKKSPEERRETGRPVPSEFKGEIKMVTDDGIRARLVNFSQKGMQAISPWPIDKGAEFWFHLAAHRDKGSGNRFKAECVYCVPVDGLYMCGVRIKETYKSGSVDFLNRVYQMMLDYNRRTVATA